MIFKVPSTPFCDPEWKQLFGHHLYIKTPWSASHYKGAIRRKGRWHTTAQQLKFTYLHALRPVEMLSQGARAMQGWEGGREAEPSTFSTYVPKPFPDLRHDIQYKKPSRNRPMWGFLQSSLGDAEEWKQFGWNFFLHSSISKISFFPQLFFHVLFFFCLLALNVLTEVYLGHRVPIMLQDRRVSDGKVVLLPKKLFPFTRLNECQV